MYKQDLALNNLQGLIYFKHNQLTKQQILEIINYMQIELVMLDSNT